MAKRGSYRIEKLAAMRWPAGILFGAAVYFVARYDIGSSVLLADSLLATCWSVALLSSIGQRERIRQLVIRHELDDLRRLHWRDAEMVVCEAFRRRGYAIETDTRYPEDDGVDLILRKHGTTTLVLCRQWSHDCIDMKAVRAMHDRMRHYHASAVKIVAVGDYTDDAWKFVAGKPFELIYGETLLAMVHEAQTPVAANVLAFVVPPAKPPMHHRARTVANT